MLTAKPMRLRSRLARLERQKSTMARNSGPSLCSIVEDRRVLRQWLASKGLSAEEALARGMNGPETISVTVTDLVRAAARVRDWRRTRFGAESDTYATLQQAQKG
jgi:hypothetical protein